MIDVLQRMLDRRRLLQSGAAGSAWILGDRLSGRAVAQDATEAPDDAADLGALVEAAQRENAIVS